MATGSRTISSIIILIIFFWISNHIFALLRDMQESGKCQQNPPEPQMDPTPYDHQIEGKLFFCFIIDLRFLLIIFLKFQDAMFKELCENQIEITNCSDHCAMKEDIKLFNRMRCNFNQISKVVIIAQYIICSAYLPYFTIVLLYLN